MPGKTVDPLVGQTLAGEFHLIRALGQGGMGAVYLAEQIALGRPVAIKLLTPAATAVPEALARFQREARAAGRLQHPNIVQVYTCACDAGRHFIAMEYVDGISLARRLLKEKRLPVSEALRIGRDVALALAAAHKQGLVHRDVKPDNIFLTADGRVKLGDFGLARDLGDAGLSQPGTVLGTPHYMSPEQSQGKTVDGRTDLYSLGATLFHALTGRPPYEGGAATEVLIKHITAPVPSASGLCAGIPDPVDALVRSLMEKDPARRPATAAEVASALDALRAGRRVPAARPAPATQSLPAPAPAARPAPSPAPVAAPGPARRVDLWRAVAIAALGALAGLGAIVAYTNRTPGPTAERRQPPSSAHPDDVPEVVAGPHPPAAPAPAPTGPRPGATRDPAPAPAPAPATAAAAAAAPEDEEDEKDAATPAPAAEAEAAAQRKAAEERRAAERRAADARAQEEARRTESQRKADAAWSAFAPAAWEPAAAGDWDAALARCVAAEADPDLQPLTDRLAALRRVLEAGGRASAAVLEGVKLQIGRDVLLRRGDGKELKGQVIGISPAGQVVIRLAEMKGAESGFPIADLAAGERIRLAASGLGNDDAAEVASAIFALALGDPAPILAFFAKDEAEQGRAGADLRLAADGWAAPWAAGRLEHLVAAHAGGGTVPAPAPAGPSDRPARRFRMGFRPVDHATFEDDSPSREETYRFLAQHGDIVAHQLEDGVPWPEAFAGRPYHANVEKQLAGRQGHKGLGPVYLAVSPLREGRITYWAGEDESERPAAWADKPLLDRDMVTAYTRFCRDLIRRFQPAYMAYAIQANSLAEDPNEWQGFLAFCRQVYGTLKKENPALPLFVTLSLNDYWKDPERQTKVIRSILPYSDYVAVSCYPYVDEPDPGRLPRDSFSAVRDLAPDKPYAVAETGFIAEPLSADVKGSTAWQEAYVRFLLEESQRLGARFVIWSIPRDIDVFYEGMEALAAKKPEVKEALPIFRSFRDCGLLDGQGQARPAFEVWESWRRRSLAPR